MFDRVVCINLQRRPERWRRFQMGLPADWPFRRVERFEAVDGQEVEPPEWYGHPHPRDNHPSKTWREDRRGIWGCLASHVAVWQHALANKLESVLVFEDDAVFCSPMMIGPNAGDFTSEVLRFLDAVPPDWDQLYLGGQLSHPRGRHNPPEIVNEHVLRCRNVNRTHAYAMRAGMMAAMIEEFTTPWQPLDSNFWHLDHRLGQFHETAEWNVYMSHRFLVGQSAGRSDVVVTRHPRCTQWWNEFGVAMPKELVPC